ncbi:MAG: tRNA-(ms[2]io[6]A)-hydroxylase [Cyclobacteriaceae bacterium]
METEFTKSTLGLELPTDPRWANVAEKNIEDILVDHAYCEQKAASSCISLIVQYPERAKLVEVLTPVVAEEWSHFERVVEQLTKRGHVLGRQRTDEYVVELMKLVRKGEGREVQLMDKLLVNALIEARSCERFKTLWQNIEDEELQKFYYELMVSEAGHYHNFLDLAREYQAEEVVMIRWRELLRAEAEIMKHMKPRADRMH